MTTSLPSPGLIATCALALCLLVGFTAWRRSTPRAWLAALPAALGAAIVGSFALSLAVLQGPTTAAWSASNLPLVSLSLLGWTWPLLVLRDARRTLARVPAPMSGARRGSGLSSGHEAGA